MKPRLLLALAALTVIGVVGAILVLQEETGEDAPAAAPTAATAERVDGALPTPPPNDDRRVEAPADDTAPRPILDSPSSLAVVEGRVIDRAGNPRGGARVVVVTAVDVRFLQRWIESTITAEADDSGRFTLVGVPTDQPLGAQVWAPNHASALVAPFRVRSGQTHDLGDIVLNSGTTLTGTVTDTEEQPIEGARVIVRDVGLTVPTAEEDERNPRVGETLTAADGTYTVPHLASRQYDITVDREGYATVSAVLSFVLGGPAAGWTQDFVMERADQRLAGRVAGPEGQPIAGALLQLVRRRPGVSTYFSTTTETDAAGAFRFPDLPEGRFDLTFTADGWYMEQPRQIDSGREDHLLYARRAITVVGQLVAEGELPRRFRVSARPDGRTGARVLGAGGMTRDFRDEEPPGSFRFTGLGPGAFAFEVIAPGFAPTRSQDVVLGPDQPEVELVIPLRRGGTIEGRLAPAGGGARIELRSGDWDPSLAIEHAFPTPPVHGMVTKTDEDGRFGFENVPAADYVVSAHPAGAPALHRRDVVVEEGETTDVGVLEVQPGGVVTGSLTGPDGRKRASATVVANGDGNHQQTRTAVDGTFTFEALPPGRYAITATPSGLFEALRFEAKGEVVVVAGEETEVDLVLTERVLQQR